MIHRGRAGVIDEDIQPLILPFNGADEPPPLFFIRNISEDVLIIVQLEIARATATSYGAQALARIVSSSEGV